MFVITQIRGSQDAEASTSRGEFPHLVTSAPVRSEWIGMQWECVAEVLLLMAADSQ